MIYHINQFLLKHYQAMEEEDDYSDAETETDSLPETETGKSISSDMENNLA